MFARRSGAFCDTRATTLSLRRTKSPRIPSASLPPGSSASRPGPTSNASAATADVQTANQSRGSDELDGLHGRHPTKTLALATIEIFAAPRFPLGPATVGCDTIKLSLVALLLNSFSTTCLTHATLPSRHAPAPSDKFRLPWLALDSWLHRFVDRARLPDAATPGASGLFSPAAEPAAWRMSAPSRFWRRPASPSPPSSAAAWGPMSGRCGRPAINGKGLAELAAEIKDRRTLLRLIDPALPPIQGISSRREESASISNGRSAT